MFRQIVVALGCLGCLVGAVRADDSLAVDDGVVREAVARGLPFLEKNGVAWMHERNCMSCHHVPFLLWSHRAAQSRGLTVDARKLAEWDEWTRDDSLSHRNRFRLQAYDLGQVDKGTLPDAVKEKLKPLIEEPFKTETEFLAKLDPLLTNDERASYRSIILKAAERTPYSVDRAGGGLDVLGQLLLGNHGTTSLLVQPEFRDGTIELMSRIQLPDGSWTPGNQFATMRRWPLATANQTTTMWAALALAAYELAGSKNSAVVEKAVDWERRQAPHPDNREWLATRALFEHRLGSAEELAKLRQQLRAASGSDGGWSWEPGLPSDPMTTGLAMYVLARIASPDDMVAVQRARAFLLAAQQPDGSWLSPSRNFTKSSEPERLKARDEIYHYWGTAWASIGLLETLGRVAK
jgi:hypothetical protein